MWLTKKNGIYCFCFVFAISWIIQGLYLKYYDYESLFNKTIEYEKVVPLSESETNR